MQTPLQMEPEMPLETPLQTPLETPLEMELQRGWASAPPARLREDSGREWRVLFAGTWNHGPGPDFRDALLLPAWGPALRGDVEIHRRPAGWHAHGHDADPAYARVLFQLSADRPRGVVPGPGAARSGPGRPAPPRDAQLVRGPPAAPPPCAQVVQRGGPAAVAAALRRLSRERLLAKADRLRAAADCDGDGEADAAAYGALFAALGAGSMGTEGGGIARIPDRLPWAQLRRGLGPSAVAGDPGGADGGFVPDGPRAIALAARLRGALPAAVAAPGRPANRPRRRLTAAATLLLRLHESGGGSLAAGLIGLARAPEREAIAALRVPRLLGAERARQLLVDAAYPFALARAPDAELIGAWQRLGGARYGRTQALRARLAAGGLGDWRNASTQALLGLERCYCRAGACAVCPLARAAGLRPGRAPLPSPNAGPEGPVASPNAGPG